MSASVVRRDRRARRDRPGGRGEPRRDLVRADDADAFALEDRGEPDEQAVVAAAKELRELGGALHRAPVEPQIGEFGPGHRADHHHLADRALLQRGEQLADLAHAHPDMRKGLDRRVGRADDADQERLAPGPARLGGDLERERARRRRGWPRGRAAAASGAPSADRSRLVVLARAGNADRPVAALPQKGDDLLHRLLIGEGLRDVARCAPSACPCR